MIDHNHKVSAGDLVRFKYVSEIIAGNIHQMEEDVGVVVSINEGYCLVAVAGNLIEACWIIEVVRKS